MAAMEVLFEITRDHPNRIIYLDQSNAIMAAMEVVFEITRDHPNRII